MKPTFKSKLEISAGCVLGAVLAVILFLVGLFLLSAALPPMRSDEDTPTEEPEPAAVVKVDGVDPADADAGDNEDIEEPMSWREAMGCVPNSYHPPSYAPSQPTDCPSIFHPLVANPWTPPAPQD